jgi:hypothetical protein
MALMPAEEALSFAIFAINTLMHPDASDPADVDLLEQKSDDVIESLADIRLTLKEIRHA